MPWLPKFLQPKEPQTTERASGAIAPTRLPGKRITRDTDNGFASSLSLLTSISGDDYWRNYNLDSKTLNRISPTKLIELLADVSPDVSRALWDFLLFMNPGSELKCFKPGTETIDKNAQKIAESFLKNLHGPFTSANGVPLEVVIASLNMGVFMRGAFFAELVLDADGRTPLEIVTPDPATVKFRRVKDDVRGEVWEVGQLHDGNFVAFNQPTIAYVPLHPLPGKPHGRAMAAPALFSSLFLIGLLHDLRRVVSQQGWPRLDLTIDFESIKHLAPTDSIGFKEWVDRTTAEVEEAFSRLEPDDTYVHSDTITVNRPVGAVDASSLGKIDALIDVLERMAMRALKSIPLLFGLSSTSNQTQSNREWEAFVAGIKSVQHLGENLLERFLTIALQVQGVQTDVEFRFAELRAAELYRDAQVALMQAEVAAYKYDRGWISQDEAAQDGAGKAKADQAEPRAATVKPAISGNGGGNPDPGSERINGHRATPLELPEERVN